MIDKDITFIRNKDLGTDCIENLIEVDRKEDARIENERDRISEICHRTEEQQGYKDSGIQESDFM
jgi:hypothetical protein